MRQGGWWWDMMGQDGTSWMHQCQTVIKGVGTDIHMVFRKGMIQAKLSRQPLESWPVSTHGHVR